MIMDGALILSEKQSLVDTVPLHPCDSTRVLDFSNAANFGAGSGPRLVVSCPSLPLSTDDQATLTVTVLVSADETSWTSLQLFTIPLANIDTVAPYIVRATLAMAAATYRYLKLTYTASAVLTSGSVTATLALDAPANTPFARHS